jgi:hypothetical protein
VTSRKYRAMQMMAAPTTLPMMMPAMAPPDRPLEPDELSATPVGPNTPPSEEEDELGTTLPLLDADEDEDAAEDDEDAEEDEREEEDEDEDEDDDEDERRTGGGATMGSEDGVVTFHSTDGHDCPLLL